MAAALVCFEPLTRTHHGGPCGRGGEHDGVTLAECGEVDETALRGWTCVGSAGQTQEEGTA
jgi:hypothetical protein